MAVTKNTMSLTKNTMGLTKYRTKHLIFPIYYKIWQNFIVSPYYMILLITSNFLVDGTKTLILRLNV